MGCYLHGLFDHDYFRQGIMAMLSERRSRPVVMSGLAHFNRQAEYDKLAALLREHLDIRQLKALCHLID